MLMTLEQQQIAAFRATLNLEELQAFDIVSRLCDIPYSSLLARAAEQRNLAAFGELTHGQATYRPRLVGQFPLQTDTDAFPHHTPHPRTSPAFGSSVDKPSIPVRGQLSGHDSTSPTGFTAPALQGTIQRSNQGRFTLPNNHHAHGFESHPSSTSEPTSAACKYQHIDRPNGVFGFSSSPPYHSPLNPSPDLGHNLLSSPTNSATPLQLAGDTHLQSQREHQTDVHDDALDDEKKTALPLITPQTPLGNAMLQRSRINSHLSNSRRAARRPTSSYNRNEVPIPGSSPPSGVKRKAKACLRCSFDKRGCLPGSGPSSWCKRCEGKNYSMDKLPCISVPMLTNLILFRTSTAGVASEPYQRIGADSQILTLNDRKCDLRPIQIGITQFGPPFPIQVQRFDIPDENGELTIVEQRLYSHQFCIEDLEKTERFLNIFIDNQMIHYIQYRADHADPLTMRIFQAVGERAQNDRSSTPLLKEALRLWTASRTIEGGWKFSCAETLLLAPDKNGTIPLVSAPMIDYQFAALMMQRVLLPLRAEVLKQLEELTRLKQWNQWLNLLLTNYILLDSLGRLMCQQRNFAHQNEYEERYPNRDLALGILESAKSLLGHYNIAYKKFLKNFKPFKMDWRDEGKITSLQKDAQLGEYDISFLKEVVPQVQRRMPHFQELMQTCEYENTHWFTGQLFIPDWVPPAALEIPQVS